MAIFFIIIAYLIGSLSSAVIVCHLLHLPDPRTLGSHNPGATNVLRIGGKMPAAVVLSADALKGLLPVLIAKLSGVQDMALALVALAAVLGHIFPLFFYCKGGKGVATTLGGLFALNIFLGLIAACVWGIVTKLSRYVSLASITAITITVLISPAVSNRYYFLPLLFINLLIIGKHWTNIVRLYQGTEAKIGDHDN